MKTRASLAAVLLLAPAAFAEIPKPDDAPRPLPPAESANAFRLTAGLSIRLLAGEPLIHEPSGICWDERGRLFVSELHGYNLEGQHDIDELNKTGQLDLEVRRIQAGEEARKKAEAGTYGTVKLLRDTNGDGTMDEAVVWADRLPPCYGLVPANGGIVIACAPDIVFLKDTDGDDRPDAREVLFTGFGTGALERGINAPTWGPDGWIYFGRGWQGGTISGPRLAKPVDLPASDFRIRADGTAIEPVSGSTRTFGMTFTGEGDRFVTTTTHPGLFVTPIAWHYLARNPNAPAPVLDGPAGDDTRVYPIAPIHPWRVKREQHAEYFAFYRKISLSDAAASGYFTSACGPLVYRDDVLPGLQGHYLVCEPAQNLIHRARIVRDGTRLRLERVEGEEESEWLASRDAWFHPISLAHTPWGGIAIVDFYREIIEDYSAIPRHLQQQYGVVNGNNRGRIWILEPDKTTISPAPSLAGLDRAALEAETENGLFWRRETARRLLLEQGATVASLDLAVWKSGDPAKRLAALRAADADHFGNNLARGIENDLLTPGFIDSLPPALALQAALSLGQSRDPRAESALLTLAKQHGSLAWMDAAIASSIPGREEAFFLALAKEPGQGGPVLIHLAGLLASLGGPAEFESLLAAVSKTPVPEKVREILRLGLEEAKPVPNPLVMPQPSALAADRLAAIEARLPEYLAAVKSATPADAEAGHTLFAGLCAACHRARGEGFAVGPDLDAEFQRAPEVILRDLLFPHESMRPGYEPVVAKTARGETLVGIGVSDSPTSVTLRLQGGGERTLLRKRASFSTLRNTSLMPDNFGETLTPVQAASLIAWLRSQP
jgi:putative membrane-bound dehydrogenase-like protein